MGKGIFAGFLAGTALSLVTLAAMSLMVPMVPPAQEVAAVTEPAAVPDPAPAPTALEPTAPAPTAPAPETEAEVDAPEVDAAIETEVEADAAPEAAIVEVPAGSEFNRPGPEEDPAVPGAEPEPERTAAPAVTAPAEEPAPSLIEVSPASPPEVSEAVPSTLTAPEGEPIGLDTAALEGGASVAVPAATSQPAPAPAQDLAAAPPPPPPSVDDLDADLAPEDIPETEAAAPVAPAVETAEVTPEAAVVTEPTPSPDAETDAETAPATAPDEPTSDLPQIGTPEPATPVAEEETPEVIDGAAPPQPGFAGTVPGVRVNRLPTIGDASPAAPEPVAEGGAESIEMAEGADTAEEPALSRHAASFQNPDNKALLAIILLDIGVEAGGLDPATLGTMSFPVTIAIDPLRPDAAEVAASYRKAGLEVAILAPELPAGATASDLEVAYQQYVAAIPEAVAIIGSPEAGLQSDRTTAQHLVALLGSEGRGLVTYKRGLNPARQAAESAGIAHAGVDRVLDETAGASDTIRRDLERSAFEAAQAGQSVVVARSYPETVTALFAFAGSQDTVALAPVSAVLLEALPEN